MARRTTKREQAETRPVLISFNEEKQAVNVGYITDEPTDDSCVPIAYFQSEEEAEAWGKQLKETLELMAYLDGLPKYSVRNVLFAAASVWMDRGMEMANKRPMPVYLVCRQCDEGGADVEAAFDDELRAYHYMDCEGGDFVEEVRLQREYENHARRTYRLQMTEGDGYGDVKCNISVVRDLTGVVREKNVRQALRWSRDAKGRLRLTAYIEGTHRYQAFKTAEKIIDRHVADVETLDEWTEYPSGRTLHPREPSQLEQDLLANLFSGSVPEEGKPLMGLFEGFMRDYEQFKRQQAGAKDRTITQGEADPRDFSLLSTTIDNQTLLRRAGIHRVSDLASHRRSEVEKLLPDERQLSVLEGWMRDLGIWWLDEDKPIRE